MSAGGRVLAIDFGTVRLGLAVSDPLGITAQPAGTLERVGPRRDVERIAAMAREHGVERVVVGLPRLLSGEEGSAAIQAREFAEVLALRLGVPVELWDERLTSAEVERAMAHDPASRHGRRRAGPSGRRPRPDRGIVDTLAAVLILQGWLDAGAGRGHS